MRVNGWLGLKLLKKSTRLQRRVFSELTTPSPHQYFMVRWHQFFTPDALSDATLPRIWGPCGTERVASRWRCWTCHCESFKHTFNFRNVHSLLICTVKPGNDPQNTTGPVTKYFLIDPHTINSNILQSVSRPHLYTCTRNTWIP